MGIVEVIHAASINTRASRHKGVLSITSQQGTKVSDRPEKRLRLNTKPIAFGDDDLEGTSQLHDDTLVVTSRIGFFFFFFFFLAKRVLIDQRSGVEIMYPDLYKGLGLK